MVVYARTLRTNLGAHRDGAGLAGSTRIDDVELVRSMEEALARFAEAGVNVDSIVALIQTVQHATIGFCLAEEVSARREEPAAVSRRWRGPRGRPSLCRQSCDPAEAAHRRAAITGAAVLLVLSVAAVLLTLWAYGGDPPGELVAALLLPLMPMWLVRWWQAVTDALGHANPPTLHARRTLPTPSR